MANIQTYGSRDWIESQYASSNDDPWGLDWRPSQRYRYQRMLKALQQFVFPRPQGLAMVDVGCATGSFTAMLAGLNTGTDGSLTGIDISESAVVRAAIRHPDIQFRLMALEDCARQFRGTLDVVTCMEVLYYLPDAQRVEAIRQLKSMLKPGGHLLVSSMIAPAPYFTLERLNVLVSQELRIVASDVLYLKPLTMLEKFLMKFGNAAARRALPLDDADVRRWEDAAKSRVPRLAASHAYVIARKD
ncbi:methyltransferase domain-containing protein [Oxalobacteraceae bacterium OM1]|nr:methyltransferase domain-containing protein [Oxalobacteraceae bacterium OM1]